MHNIFTIQNIQYQPEDLEITVFFIPYKVLNVKLELGSTCPVQLPHWCVQSVTHGTISNLFLFYQDTFLTIHLLWKLNLIPNRSKNKHDGVTRPGLVISGKESGEIQFGPVRCSWFSPVPLSVQWSLICALSTPPIPLFLSSPTRFSSTTTQTMWLITVSGTGLWYQWG